MFDITITVSKHKIVIISLDKPTTTLHFENEHDRDLALRYLISPILA